MIETIVAPVPIGVPGLMALAAGLILFAGAVLFARWRYRASGASRRYAARSQTSLTGVIVQALAFLAVAIGPIRPILLPASAPAVGIAVTIGILCGVAIGMFLSATAAMQQQWSVVARTRHDHVLVTWGPFATLRHPIYTGLFLLVIAVAIAFGHWRGLVLAVPLYWAGTWLRVREEERLLRERFGAEYEGYAARVKRFVPRLL
ncbi:methyltransferase family protein [Sphingomonas sp. RS6]